MGVTQGDILGPLLQQHAWSVDRVCINLNVNER